jgi:hypothetical protein
MDNILNDADYTLANDCDSLWITVGTVSVWVSHDADGTVRVALFPAGEEMDEPLDVAHAYVRKV